MPSLEHLHTYERMPKPQQNYYRCIHPHCSHYVHSTFLKGKAALCACGEEYILNSTQLKLLRPHCPFCGKNPQARIEVPPELILPRVQGEDYSDELQIHIGNNKFKGPFGGEI